MLQQIREKSAEISAKRLHFSEKSGMHRCRVKVTRQTPAKPLQHPQHAGFVRIAMHKTRFPHQRPALLQKFRHPRLPLIEGRIQPDGIIVKRQFGVFRPMPQQQMIV
jgi:hypothetical protein